jgi:hypothetical protein
VGDDLQPASRLNRGTTGRQASDNQAEANQEAAHAGYYTPGAASNSPLKLLGGYFTDLERGNGGLHILVDFQEHIETGDFHGAGNQFIRLEQF